jgi:hypothetical protein
MSSDLIACSPVSSPTALAVSSLLNITLHFSYWCSCPLMLSSNVARSAPLNVTVSRHPSAATTGSASHTHQSPTTHTPFETLSFHPVVFCLSPCLSSGGTNYHLSDHDLLLPGAVARPYRQTDKQQNMWDGNTGSGIYYCLAAYIWVPIKVGVDGNWTRPNTAQCDGANRTGRHSCP